MTPVRRSAWVFVSAVALLVGGLARAMPVPAFDVRALVEQSDVIVSGMVSVDADGRPASITLIGGSQVTARVVTARVMTDQQLKNGTGATEVDFELVIPSEPIGYQTIQSGSTSVVFLKRSGNGLVLTSPYYPSLPAISGARLSSADPFGRVVELLRAVVASPSSRANVKRHAIMALWGITSPSPTEAFANALGESDESVQLTAAATLLRIGDVRGLSIAEDALLSRPGAAPELLHNLNVAIRDGVSDVSALSTLTRLLERGDSFTRTAAATALGRTQSDLAVQPLVGALDDAERAVRYNAAVGLASVTGAVEWRPSPYAFDRDEQRYIQHWKEWARTR